MLNKHYTKVFSTLHENNNVNLLREKSNLLVLFRNLSDKSAGVQPSSDVGCRLESEFQSFGYRLTPLNLSQTHPLMSGMAFAHLCVVSNVDPAANKNTRLQAKDYTLLWLVCVRREFALRLTPPLCAQCTSCGSHLVWHTNTQFCTQECRLANSPVL